VTAELFLHKKAAHFTTGEQELLGIIKALKKWRCYLEGCQGLTIVTDYNPLMFFSKQPTLSRRQARWSEFMSRFQFTVKYRLESTLNQVKIHNFRVMRMSRITSRKMATGCMRAE
jgi:hypothetical protein